MNDDRQAPPQHLLFELRIIRGAWLWSLEQARATLFGRCESRARPLCLVGVRVERDHSVHFVWSE